MADSKGVMLRNSQKSPRERRAMQAVATSIQSRACLKFFTHPDSVRLCMGAWNVAGVPGILLRYCENVLFRYG